MYKFSGLVLEIYTNSDIITSKTTVAFFMIILQAREIISYKYRDNWKFLKEQLNKEKGHNSWRSSWQSLYK